MQGLNRSRLGASDNRREMIPRIQKIPRDGTTRIVATVTRG
jgi:hypothetical protein